jgi:membrane protein
MLAYFKLPIGWGELFKRTAHAAQEDDALGLSAQLAYYFFLALAPALLFLVALAGMLPADQLVPRIVGMLQGVAPPEVITIIEQQLTQIGEGGAAGLLTIGVLVAIWSSSAAMVAVISALNRAYDVEDARPWWKQRLTAILLTIGAAFFLLVSILLMIAGPPLAEWVAAQAGLGAAFEWTWKIAQWPIIFALVVTAFSLIYYFAPDVDQDFVWLTPGAVVATALWFAGSLGFRFYVVNFGDYNATYGAIGGVIVLLLWLYVTGLVIIAGAEMNAEIEHASPHGKDAGEKVPGQRKSIGARAAREFEEKQAEQQRTGRVVRPAPQPRPAGHLRPEALARIGLVVTGAIATLFGRRVVD